MNKQSLPYWAWALFLTYALQVDTFAAKEAFLANDTHTSSFYTHQGGLQKDEGAAIYERLGQIDFWHLEHPESAQDLSTREVERVREAFEGIYIQKNKLPDCVTKSIRWDIKYLLSCKRKVYSLYKVLQYIYGDKSQLGWFSTKGKKNFASYEATKKAGIQLDHWMILEDAIQRSYTIVLPYCNYLSFRKAFKSLTQDAYEVLLGDDIRISRDGCFTDKSQTGLIAYWIDQQVKKRYPLDMVELIMSYVIEEGATKREYDKVLGMNEYIFNGKQVGREGIPGLLVDYNQMKTADFYVFKVEEILKGCTMNTQRLPYTVMLEETETCYKGIGGGLGVYERHYFYEVYSLLKYIRSKSYKELVEEGWLLEHFLIIEEAVQSHFSVNPYCLLCLKNDPNLSKNYALLTGGYGCEPLNNIKI